MTGTVRPIRARPPIYDEHPSGELAYSDAVGRRKGRGFVAVDGGFVGWINGGEPVDGCAVVSLMIFASTPADVKMRAREIGLWHPYVMEHFGNLDPEGVTAAVADPDRFVWRDGSGGDWRPSAELERSGR
jgi:hypothetical protein